MESYIVRDEATGQYWGYLWRDGASTLGLVPRPYAFDMWQAATVEQALHTRGIKFTVEVQ